MRFDVRAAKRAVAVAYGDPDLEGASLQVVLERVGQKELSTSLTTELAWNDWCNRPGVDIWARVGDEALKTKAKEPMALQYEFSVLWRAYVRQKFINLSAEELSEGEWVDMLRRKKCFGISDKRVLKLDPSQRQVLAACISFLRIPMATYNGPKPGVYGLQFLIPRLQLIAGGPGLVACAKLAARIVDQEDF